MKNIHINRNKTKKSYTKIESDSKKNILHKNFQKNDKSRCPIHHS